MSQLSSHPPSFRSQSQQSLLRQVSIGKQSPGRRDSGGRVDDDDDDNDDGGGDGGGGGDEDDYDDDFDDDIKIQLLLSYRHSNGALKANQWE